MEPVSLIMGALSAAATVAGKEIIKKEAGRAYDRFRTLLLKKIRTQKATSTEVILEEFEKAPELSEDLLKAKLKELDFGADTEITRAAAAFLEFVPKGRQIIAQHYSEYTCPVTQIGHVDNLIIQNSDASAEAEEETVKMTSALKAYLGKIMKENQVLPLEGIDWDVCTEGGSRMRLDRIYVPLFAKAGRQGAELAMEIEPGEMGRSGEEIISLVELVGDGARARWVFLGDPGYGKTTFTSFLTFCMAGALLGEGEGNLALLTKPLASEAEEADDEKPDPYAWELGALLPVRVVLRDLAAQDWLDDSCDSLLDRFWEFLASKQPEDIRAGAVQGIQKWFRHHGGILMLDGLDEIPEDDRIRKGIKALIRAFETGFDRVRLLVTSRPYAYQKEKWQLPGFESARLTPFSEEQIRAFIHRWYDQAALLGRVSGDGAKGGVRDLERAVFSTQSLKDIARSPLLLTQLASLHVFKGRQLPEKREAIYDASLELLLGVWERHKTEGGDDCPMGPRLSEELGVGLEEIQKAVQKLAFEIHEAQGQGGENRGGVADIPREKLIKSLTEIPGARDIRPNRLEEYLACRAGILVNRGEGVYSFPHRTFQEYLAARHLAEMDDDNEALIRLTTESPEQWREAGLLFAARRHGYAVSAFWDLMEGWCGEELPEKEDGNDITLKMLWGALMAGMAVAESVDLNAGVSPRREKTLARLRTWMVRILEGRELPALERATAGNVLAKIGDPRFDPGRYFLPVGEDMGFIPVPAGHFSMGTPEKFREQVRAMERFDFFKELVNGEFPCHLVDVPLFKVGRYPVTKAQYRVFVQETDRWDQDFEEYGLDNHPVAGVSWQDARDYCIWLSKKLDLKVDLSTEAQWEKAARWGSDTLYPWGDAIDSERANYGESPIQGTSPVGCFQLGASDGRPQDMIGNVWEWTLDHLHSSYDDAPDDGNAWVDRNAKEGSNRVVRGGSFIVVAGNCRSAYRLGRRPSLRYQDVGFRLVLPPGRQAEQA